MLKTFLCNVYLLLRRTPIFQATCKYIYCLQLCLTLTNDKILDWPKSKAFAEEKINVTEELTFVSEKEENIVGKGESYPHFLLMLQRFPKPSS